MRAFCSSFSIWNRRLPWATLFWVWPGWVVLCKRFLRKAHKLVAPAKVATIREEVTFQQIVDRRGWTLHGTDDDVWYEHMTCCIALQCSFEAYDRIGTKAAALRADPGIYRLLSRNCIHVCRELLAAGGVRLLRGDGRPFRTILPCQVFCRSVSVTGAVPFRAWKYWFPAVPAPKDGHRVRPVRLPALMGQSAPKGHVGVPKGHT